MAATKATRRLIADLHKHNNARPYERRNTSLYELAELLEQFDDRIRRSSKLRNKCKLLEDCVQKVYDAMIKDNYEEARPYLETIKSNFGEITASAIIEDLREKIILEFAAIAKEHAQKGNNTYKWILASIEQLAGENICGYRAPDGKYRWLNSTRKYCDNLAKGQSSGAQKSTANVVQT